MSEYLSENWVTILVAVLYIVSHSKGISSQWKRRAAVLMGAIDKAPEMLGCAKDNVKGSEFNDDLKLNSILDKVSPHADKRVPLGRKIVDGLVNLIPFVSLLRR